MSLADEATEDQALPLRVLFFDVETAPLLSFHWRVWKENIAPSQIERESFMLCWAARWQGQKRILSDLVTADEALAQDDGRIVESLAELVRTADVIVAHNVDRFDLPVLNTRLLHLGLDPLPPVRTLDTLKVAKKSFKKTFNRLSYLADSLGIEAKHAMVFDDWRRACAGNVTALKKMRSYCRQDIEVLEAVFEAMRPYAKGLPRLVEATREMQRACPHCGAGFEFQEPSGLHRTNASNFHRYRCERCGKFSRGRNSVLGKQVSLVPL